jgi:hypothetical protein
MEMMMMTVAALIRLWCMYTFLFTMPVSTQAR